MKETDTKHCKKLLDRISFRVRLNSFINSAYLSIVVLLAIYAILLLCSRLLTLIPDYFTLSGINLITLIIPIIVALIIAIFVHKKPTQIKSAKLADKHHGTKDLFLTATSIGSSFGEYQSLVIKNGEDESKKVDHVKVVKIEWVEKIRNISIILLLIVLGAAFIPQLDPFGSQLVKKRVEENRENLKVMNRAVEERLKQLKKKTVGKNSPEIEKMLAKVKEEFNTMKRSELKRNEKRLKELQKELSKGWRRKNESMLRDKIEKNISNHSFGLKNKKEESWKKQLEKNSFKGIKKEVKELQQIARAISQMQNGAEKTKKEAELKKRMKSMSDFMSSQMGSQSVQNAMNQAMKQMNMNQEGLDKKAIQDALNNSMELMNRELERLSEMSQDIRDLEMAMQAAQLAQQLNQLNKLKGAGKQGLEEIEDYADYYNKMMENAQCSKDGEGTGQQGKGGGFPGENVDAQMGVKREISKSKLQAGKILMKWNVKGMGKSGSVKEEYLESIKKVKQGVSEAILKEQVPPGYHKSIKKYFDNIKPTKK